MTQVSSSSLTPWWQQPLWIRVLPFVGFLMLTSLQGSFGESSIYWVYVLKTVVGCFLLAFMWPKVAEMRWSCSPEAIAVGFLCFIVWVGLDGFYPRLDEVFDSNRASEPDGYWNPLAFFEASPSIAWLVIGVRILGSALIVPPLEEVFYRSTVYRYIIDPKIESVGLGQFHGKAFLGTCLLFGLVHQEWLAGVICGIAFQWLVLRKQRLGDAISAHAITNLLLGLSVVGTKSWRFW